MDTSSILDVSLSSGYVTEKLNKILEVGSLSFIIRQRGGGRLRFWESLLNHGGMAEKEMHLFFLPDISIYLS